MKIAQYFEVTSAAGHKMVVKLDAITLMNQFTKAVFTGQVRLGVLTVESFEALLEEFKKSRRLVEKEK